MEEHQPRQRLMLALKGHRLAGENLDPAAIWRRVAQRQVKQVIRKNQYW